MSLLTVLQERGAKARLMMGGKKKKGGDQMWGVRNPRKVTDDKNN